MAIRDYQYSYNSFVMGRGTKVRVLSVEGLFSLPDVISSDTPQEGSDGEYSSGDESLSGRVIAFEVALEASRRTGADDLYEELQAATSNFSLEQPLLIKRPGRPERMLLCKVRRRQFTSNASFARGLGKGALEFKAYDPRIYSSTLNQPDPFYEARPSATEGRAYPRTYPLKYKAVPGPSNMALLKNDGTYPTPGVIRIMGPIMTPILENFTLGTSMKFNTTLGVGEFLELNLDPAERSILLNGTADRSRWLDRSVSNWFLLGPGVTALRLRGSGTSFTGQFTAQWRSAWV